MSALGRVLAVLPGVGRAIAAGCERCETSLERVYECRRCGTTLDGRRGSCRQCGHAAVEIHEIS